MDRSDRKILQALQREGRISNQQLAEEVGMSSAACWRRVRALEAAGVISGYTALLERSQLGLELCAFVHVSLSRHEKKSTESFEGAVRDRPEVLECFATTGDADFILRVVTADIASFDAFLEEFLFGLAGISQVRSNICLRELKFATALPLPAA
ncbi:MAG: Lrp/AsnC family transcriptional regulator [Halieaceae bacterium]